MIKIVDIPVYRCSVVFLIGTTREEWKKFYEQQRPKITETDYVNMLDEYDLGSTGCVLGTDGNDYICYIKDSSNEGLCIHELFHVAHSVLWDRNYRPDEAAEPVAYLLEFLVSEFNKFSGKRR